MSVRSVVPPFRRLLNSISSELSSQNLASLIHVCGEYIPESNREGIRNGLDLFHILNHQNVIGDDLEKARNLEQFVKAMRPKRKDIIRRVRDFIRTNYDPDDFRSTSGDSYVNREPASVLVKYHNESPCYDQYNSSGQESPSVQRNPFLEVSPVSTENHCSMDCCCWGCNCYARRIPSCVLLMLAGIMATFTFVACLLWFDGIPHNLYRKLASSPDGIKAGGYVVGCFGAATIAFLSWWIYRKVHGRRQIGQIPYHSFTDEHPMNSCSNVAEKAPISPESVTLAINKQQKRRPRPLGCVTAGSCPEMAASAPVLEKGKRHHGSVPKRLRRPRRQKKNSTEEGVLQIEGTSSSSEGADDETLFTA